MLVWWSGAYRRAWCGFGEWCVSEGLVRVWGVVRGKSECASPHILGPGASPWHEKFGSPTRMMRIGSWRRVLPRGMSRPRGMALCGLCSFSRELRSLGERHSRGVKVASLAVLDLVAVFIRYLFQEFSALGAVFLVLCFPGRQQVPPYSWHLADAPAPGWFLPMHASDNTWPS